MIGSPSFAAPPMTMTTMALSNWSASVVGITFAAPSVVAPSGDTISSRVRHRLVFLERYDEEGALLVPSPVRTSAVQSRPRRRGRYPPAPAFVSCPCPRRLASPSSPPPTTRTGMQGGIARPPLAARAPPNPRRHPGPRIDPLASPSTGPSSACARLLLPASSRRPSLLDFRGLPAKSS